MEHIDYGLETRTGRKAGWFVRRTWPAEADATTTVSTQPEATRIQSVQQDMEKEERKVENMVRFQRSKKDL